MKTKNLYTFLSILWCLLMGTTACHEEADNSPLPVEETGTLTMQFQLTPSGMSRSGYKEVTDLYYTVKDGVLIPCEAPVNHPESRAGDGNVAYGGGMADLTVFLVDANDKIVASQSLSALSNVTTQTVTFHGLELETYTAYAYANTIGNDWFTMPTENETSFTNYKDAQLKVLNGTVPPTIANERMPLTGKAEITVQYGGNNGTIEMIRPVARLTVTIKNDKDIAIEPSSLSLGNIFPATGYVFPHETILPQNATGNPYYVLPNLTMNATVLPNSSHLIYESLLYETQIDEAINVSMSYKSEDVTVQDFTGSLSGIDQGTKIIIRLTDSDLYLSIDPGTKELIMVSAAQFDENCIWYLYGSGGNKRPIEHSVYRGYYIDTQNHSITQSSKPNSYFLTFSGEASATIIDYIKYDISNSTFSVNNSNPSTFVLSSLTDAVTSESNISQEILEKISETETRPLMTIRRNQDVHLNIVFK